MSGRTKPQSARSRLADVARRARVSTMTVARVLREPHKVAPDTRARVSAALDATGYTPDLVARALVSRRSGVVGAIVPTLSNSLIADVIQGMSDALARENRQLMVGASGFSAAGEEALVRSFLSRRVDGLYLTGTSHTAGTRALLANAGIPVIEGGNVPETAIDMAVGVSNIDAAAAVVAHLVGSYGPDIAFAGAPAADNDRMRDRRAGYERVLAEAGARVPPAWIVETPMSMEGGREAVRRLLALPRPPRALFCANDVIAAGALLEAVRRGVAVPGTLAVAGYDDLDIARELLPSLTSVRVPRYEIGKRAAELIHLALTGKRPRRAVEALDFELVVRESA
jgi:LacI family transcriptional regulator, gluconate utilization system Gnt-I transcriptional repressor